MIQCTKGTMVDADGIRTRLFSFWWNRDCGIVDACSHSSLLTSVSSFMLARQLHSITSLTHVMFSHESFDKARDLLPPKMAKMADHTGTCCPLGLRAGYKEHIYFLTLGRHGF